MRKVVYAKVDMLSGPLDGGWEAGVEEGLLLPTV